MIVGGQGRKRRNSLHRSKLADEYSVSVSSSTVYKDGQIPSREEYGKEGFSNEDFDYTPDEPNELWQMNISYIPIKNHDFWYLISALGGYSRRIMSHTLSSTMGTDDLIGIIDNGILDYGLNDDPPKFLTDNGTQMTSNRFREYEEGLEVDHLRAPKNPTRRPLVKLRDTIRKTRTFSRKDTMIHLPQRK